MGGGAIWFHAPFLQFKENPPRDDPHSEGGGDWSSSAQAQLARRHRLRSCEGHRKLGTGLGPVMVQQSQEECFLLLLNITYKGEPREERQHVPHLVHCS